MGGQAREIIAGERKKDRLKKEIEHMWSELEGTFNLNQITEMENELKAQKTRLLEIYQDTQGQAQVRKQQNAAIDEKNKVSSKLQGKANNFQNQLREAKQKLKAETEMQRKIMNDIKQKHTEILRLEARQKQFQTAIRD